MLTMLLLYKLSSELPSGAKPSLEAASASAKFVGAGLPSIRGRHQDLAGRATRSAGWRPGERFAGKPAPTLSAARQRSVEDGAAPPTNPVTPLRALASGHVFGQRTAVPGCRGAKRGVRRLVSCYQDAVGVGRRRHRRSSSSLGCFGKRGKKGDVPISCCNSYRFSTTTARWNRLFWVGRTQERSEQSAACTKAAYGFASTPYALSWRGNPRSTELSGLAPYA